MPPGSADAGSYLAFPRKAWAPLGASSPLPDASFFLAFGGREPAQLGQAPHFRARCPSRTSSSFHLPEAAVIPRTMCQGEL